MKHFILAYFILIHFVHSESEIPFIENSRLSFDLSSRVSYYERDEEATLQQFFGIDFHKVFNNGHQDIGALTLQPYMHRIDNGIKHPSYYDDAHDWEFILRTATFTFTGLGNQYPWIKVGHFELPFGVEYTKNTFGNLHQYQQGPKLGMKVDWGLSLGQELEDFQYEFSMTRGSGLKYRNRQNPYAFSGRISTLDDSYWALGISFFYGEVLNDKTTIKRELMAVDFQYFHDSWGFLTELYAGNINHQKAFGSLWEINWRNADETLELYSQYVFRDSQNTPEYSALISGIKYRITPQLILSTQATFELSQARDNQRSSIFEFQLRYYF